MDTNNPAICVENLFFGYTKDQPVLADVSFSIQEREYVGIIGPNGGGKTTLLKLLLGFLNPVKGSLSVFGKSPKSYPNDIAYVPQALRFDKQFPITVLELVLGGRLRALPWWGRFSEKDKIEALDALKKVGLSEIYSRPLGTLSGGQIQRALIARALVSNPKILLLDEPTAGIDPEAVGDIYTVLQNIRHQHTILMVTHDIQAVISQVERVLCVQGGVASIEPNELCEHFALGLYHFPLLDTPKKHFIGNSKPAKAQFIL